MTLQQLFVQTALTFVAAVLGLLFGAFLTRRADRYRQLQALRSAAYVDFLRGISKLAIVQRDTLERNSFEEREAMIAITDSKARIAIYGSKTIVRALSAFIDGGTVLNTAERMHAFAELCQLMRSESTTFAERASFEDIHKLLFS